MSSDSGLARLIEASYDAAETSRSASFTAAEVHMQLAADTGSNLLRVSPSVPGACTYLTAAWTAILRDSHNLPAYCVAGDLCVRGRMAFGCPDLDLSRCFDASSNAWDGHCWLALGQLVGDISVFRTAYAQPENSNLRQVVLEEFGSGRGLLLMHNADALAAGFEYRPKYVLREAQVTSLIQGARANRML
jgi:hypothetical protein